MGMLEGRCALEAASRAKPEDILKLEAVHGELERFAQSNQVERYFEANQEFHRRIQEISGNRWLQQMIQDLRKVLKLTRMHSLTIEGRLQQSLIEHRVIMAAIKARDPKRAEQAMHEHLLAGRQALSKSHLLVPA
jgi:DNA-binding GntR family transcriptional regulator